MNDDFPGDEIRRFLVEDEERRKLIASALVPYAGIRAATTAFEHYESVRSALKTMDPFGSMRSALSATNLIAQEAEKLSKMARDADLGWRGHFAHSVRDALEGHAMATRAMDSLLGRIRPAKSSCAGEVAQGCSCPRHFIADTWTLQESSCRTGGHGGGMHRSSGSGLCRRAVSPGYRSRPSHWPMD